MSDKIDRRLPILLSATLLVIVAGSLQARVAAAGSVTSTFSDTRRFELLVSKSDLGVVRARVYKATKRRTVFYVRGYGRNLCAVTEVRCDMSQRGDGAYAFSEGWHRLLSAKLELLDPLHNLL